VIFDGMIDVWSGSQQRQFAKPSGRLSQNNPKPRQEFRKERLGVKGWRYSEVPLSQTKAARWNRIFNERIKRHVDARVCQHCKYAFLSIGGKNLCSPCWEGFWQEYLMIPPQYRLNLNQRAFHTWLRLERGVYTRVSKHPHYPIPDLGRPQVAAAVTRALELVRAQIEADRWTVGKCPRLSPGLYYPQVQRAVLYHSPPLPREYRFPGRTRLRVRDHWTGRVCAHPPVV
jgi:hypothetical protein